MGFFDSLANGMLMNNGVTTGQITCKSKQTYQYYASNATEERQCRCCGKTIKPGKQIFACLSSWDAGKVMSGEKIDKITNNLYCSLDCFRRAN